MTEDNSPSQQFEDMMRSFAKKEEKGSEGKIYVSFAPDESGDPEFLERVQQVGELFSDEKIRKEFLKTQEPNAILRGDVTKIYKWKSKDGKGRVDISYVPQGIDVPFPIGFQRQEGDTVYELLKNLPDDYDGEIIVALDEKGHISSISLPENDTE